MSEEKELAKIEKELKAAGKKIAADRAKDNKDFDKGESDAKKDKG